MAAMLAVCLCCIIGRSLFVWLAITVAMAVLVVSPFLWVNEEQVGEVYCEQPISANLDWRFQLVRDFDIDGQWVSSNIGSLCTFSDEPDTGSTVGITVAASAVPSPKRIKLNGGGLVSSPLPGLREAVSKTRQLTFGIRFSAEKLQAGRPPRQVVALQSNDERPLVVARVLQNGPHASASISFKQWQSSSTSMLNRLQPKFHEIVLTYDGSVQTTYFDSVPVGSETTQIEAIEQAGSELLLSIGKRTDGRWNAFHGEIEAIIIGSTSVSADKIGSLFQSR